MSEGDRFIGKHISEINGAQAAPSMVMGVSKHRERPGGWSLRTVKGREGAPFDPHPDYELTPEARAVRLQQAEYGTVLAPEPYVSKNAEFLDKVETAREEFMRHEAEAWLHYKGGVYTVDGFEIDTDDHSVRVRHMRISGPSFSLHERNVPLSRPLRERFDIVTLPEPMPGHPNLVDPEEPRRVRRFVPVHKIQRYETVPQQTERN